MRASNRILQQFAILTTLLGIGILAACSPAAAPTPPASAVGETVVVTQLVEVEGPVTVVTATAHSVTAAEESYTQIPAATQPVSEFEVTVTPSPPSATSEPVAVLPRILDIEDRRIEVEWPASMQPNESTTIRLAFVPVEGGALVVTEFPGDHLQVTQVSIKQLDEFELSAIALLDGVGFAISPAGEQVKQVTAGEPLTWYWTVSPKQTGRQRLSLSLSLRWKPFTGEGQVREAVLYSKALTIQVVETSSLSKGMRMGAMVCMASLFGIGAISLGVWVLGRPKTRRSADLPPPVSASLLEMDPTGRAPASISIEPPPGMVLSPSETTLLSTLFSRYARLVIEREFLSGYSGARTFLAVPIRPDSRVDARTIVKIASERSVQQEYENYENFVKTTLPPATARIQQPPVSLEGLAALQYTFLGGPADTPTSLRQALLGHPDPSLLWKLFDTFAPTWWMQHKPYVFRLGQEYDRKLPAHYVLEPVNETPALTLDGQQPLGSAGDLTPGMILALKNFPHVEPRPDGKSLALVSDPLPGHPPVRVRWLAPALGTSPVGRITATRWTMLKEACAGLNLFDLPDPLEKLPALLGERVNGTQSLIHGDLNVENVLVGPGEWVWLIDFAETRDGHTLYDFAHLYMELVAHELAPQILRPSDYLALLQGGAAPLLAAVREMAGRCLFDPKEPQEFDLALAVSCLGALKYVNLTPHARHLLYLTAAYHLKAM